MFTDEQFSALAKKYIDTVFRVALNYLKNGADADDVTQNVFLKLWREKRDFDGEAHIRYWLIRVTVNECKAMLRAPWRHAESFEDYAGKLSFEDRAQSDLFFAVMDLPQKYRVPIYLHYYEGYSTDEIGRMLKQPRTTVSTHLHRGRKLLAAALEEANDDV